jgi:hypothetical protein
MAFTKINYPEFKDIRLFHVHGYDADAILVEVAEFIQHPDHADYRLIDQWVNYMDPDVPTVEPNHPGHSKWIEASILYTE